MTSKIPIDVKDWKKLEWWWCGKRNLLYLSRGISNGSDHATHYHRWKTGFVPVKEHQKTDFLFATGIKIAILSYGTKEIQFSVTVGSETLFLGPLHALIPGSLLDHTQELDRMVETRQEEQFKTFKIYRRLTYRLLFGIRPFSNSLSILTASQWPSFPSYRVSTTLNTSPLVNAKLCGVSFSHSKWVLMKKESPLPQAIMSL